MAAFPVPPTIAYNPSVSSEETVMDDIQVDRAMNGDAKGRAFYTNPKRKFSLVYNILTSADKATIHAFYLANRLISFTFVWAADGQTYTCIFSGPPKYQPVEGLRWKTTIVMEEV